MIDEEAKRDLLEKSASDILCNYQKLSKMEQDAYDKQFGHITEDMLT